jgi:CRISPR system Cascade subunit CasE
MPDKEAGGAGHILFRLENSAYAPTVLVQSTRLPDWSVIRNYTTAIEGPKSVSLRDQAGVPRITKGSLYKFRLLANPTKKQQFGEGASRPGHRRIGLYTEAEQSAWLMRKAEQHGFALMPLPEGPSWCDPLGDDNPKVDVRIRSEGMRSGRRRNEVGTATQLKHLGVQFEGVLRVTDPALFTQALQNGIGSGKAFGFGLLSIARL